MNFPPYQQRPAVWPETNVAGAIVASIGAVIVAFIVVIVVIVQLLPHLAR